MDKTLGGGRRFSKADLGEIVEKHGFAVKRVYQLNKIGTPGWWLYSKVLRRNHINKLMLKLFDKTVWFWRCVEALLPWRGLSLVVVATKEQSGGGGFPVPARDLQRDVREAAVFRRLPQRPANRIHGDRDFAVHAGGAAGGYRTGPAQRIQAPHRSGEIRLRRAALAGGVAAAAGRAYAGSLPAESR